MKVSVIVPVHDSERYLPDCLASIQAQGIGDIEVLCIDDASRDSSRAICREFARGDSRFQLVELPENGGAAHARNIGIRQAQGDYLAFMDADDWYPAADCLELLHSTAVAHGCDLVAGSIDRYDQQSGKLLEPAPGEEHLACFTFDEPGWVDFRDWQFDYGFTRFLYRRAFLRDAGIEFPALRRHEDPVFLVRCLAAAGGFHAVPDVVYRIRMGYKAQRFGEAQLDDALEGISQVLAISYEHDLPELRRWQKQLLRQYVVETQGVLGDFFLKDLLHESASRIARKAPAAILGRLPGAKGGR